MHDLIAIGRFAQITQLSIRALRLYDEMGLLRPRFIDADTGYRYYSITQLPLARQIRLLRSVDMPLDAIHTVVHAATAMDMDALLREHQQRIIERMEKDRQALVVLQRMIDHQTDDLVFTVRVKEQAAQSVASIRFQTTPADEPEQILSVLRELEQFAQEHGVRRHDAPPTRISHAYSEEMVDSEIVVPITRLPAGTERIATTMLGAETVAYVMHVGPHADLWAVYWALLNWIEEQGHERGNAPREVYWQHPSDGTTSAYRTEVQWPIRAARTSAADERSRDAGA